MRLQGRKTRPKPCLQDIDAALHVLPEALDRVQLGTLGRQPHQDDVVRHLDTPGSMGRGLIEEDNRETLRRGLAPLP